MGELAKLTKLQGEQGILYVWGGVAGEGVNLMVPAYSNLGIMVYIWHKAPWITVVPNFYNFY